MVNIPLAERLRPTSLNEIVGQDHLLSEEGFITKIVKNKIPLSILLWGPPGCGKTTLARLYAQAFSAQFVSFSAVSNGIGDLKKMIQDIDQQPLLRRQTIIFVDEIHRFNKAQQDVFLPFLEKGTIVLIGATTENPSFSLNDALLSRLRVLTVKSLEGDALEKIIVRFESKAHPLNLTPSARQLLLEYAHGDARHLLNMIENIVHGSSQGDKLDEHGIQALVLRRNALYDKQAEGHYNLISALHKSVRGSDPDAALYWLARMLKGGEDPQFVARRIVRMAGEDIGLANPQALAVALDAWRAYDQLGHPEGELALAQAIVYLALSPKSNAIYTAFSEAQALAEKTSQHPPPKTILNVPTRLMKDLGYGKGYQYDHDAPLAFSGQDYFPEEIGRSEFYRPKEYGFEREMSKRLEYFKKFRERIKKPSPI